MSELDCLMSGIIDLFQKYAKKEGSKYTLSSSEANDLIRKEFTIDAQGKGEQMQQYLRLLDGDGDGEVTFVEFMSVVAIFTVFTNMHLMESSIPPPPKAK